MSTVHHDPSWNPSRMERLLFSRIPGEKPMTKTYRPKAQSTTSLLIGAYAGIIDHVLKNTKTAALIKLAERGLGVFGLNPNSSIENAANELLNLTAQQAQHMVAVIGRPIEDYKKCVVAAKEIALGFFAKKGNPMFSYRATKKEVEEQCTNLANQLFIESFSNFDMEQRPAVSFTKEDLEAFQIDARDVNADPKQICCLAYALLQARETQARGYIFQAKGDNKALKNVFESLHKWNWLPVDAPDEGDLVIYLDQDNSPKHAGYFTEGMVCSKLGMINPHSYLHELEDVLPLFESVKFCFFRKRRYLETDQTQGKAEGKSTSKKGSSAKSTQKPTDKDKTPKKSGDIITDSAKALENVFSDSKWNKNAKEKKVWFQGTKDEATTIANYLKSKGVNVGEPTKAKGESWLVILLNPNLELIEKIPPLELWNFF